MFLLDFECSPDGFKTSLSDLAVSKPKSMPLGIPSVPGCPGCGMALGMDLGVGGFPLL